MTTDLRPADAAMLRDMVAFLVERKAPTEIVGAGTKRSVGRPTNAEYLLDLSKLAGIREYEPNELVLTCGAATPLWTLESALASNNQQLAFEPVDYGPLLGGPAARGTIGGVLSANLSGPRRFKAGAARDHFLGVDAVSGRGEAFKAGGKVVKNVTGHGQGPARAGSDGDTGAARPAGRRCRRRNDGRPAKPARDLRCRLAARKRRDPVADRGLSRLRQGPHGRYPGAGRGAGG